MRKEQLLEVYAVAKATFGTLFETVIVSSLRKTIKSKLENRNFEQTIDKITSLNNPNTNLLQIE